MEQITVDFFLVGTESLLEWEIIKMAMFTMESGRTTAEMDGEFMKIGNWGISMLETGSKTRETALGKN